MEDREDRQSQRSPYGILRTQDDLNLRDSLYHSDTASFALSHGDGGSITGNLERATVPDGPETRLVIGLDYGTTYTGVAYATPLGTRCVLDDIDVMVEWGASVNDKVPSVISYSRKEYEWGEAISADAVCMVHTKLELGLQNVLGELNMTLQVLDGMTDLNFDEMLTKSGSYDVPAYSSKSPEEIVTDYLTKIFQYMEQEVNKFGKAARMYTTTDLVVTVPTEWSYMAMNSTYRALTKAGFNHDNFMKLQDVMFITEPEAAAQYTARHYRDEERNEFLEEGQYFILCDAGGGTVDVISYQVKKLRPLLQLEQVGGPTGDRSGSIFINFEFKKWLRIILTDEHYQKLDPNLDIDKFATHASETPPMRALMKEFDLKKKDFGLDGYDCQLELPAPIEDLTIVGRVNQGLLTIRRHEMESFFDASITRIVDLIKGHVRRIREQRHNRPKNLFLVGGYGESKYLQAQIKDMLEQERMIMQFRRPQKSWTAVVRGAVVCGVEKTGNDSLKRTKSCRHSYGLCLDEIYSSSHHSRDDAKQIGETTLANSQLDWLLNKGDLVLSGSPTIVEKTVKLRLMKLRQDTLKLPVWRNLSDEKYRPIRYDDAADELWKAAELEIDLSKINFERPRSNMFSKTANYEANLKVVFKLDWDVLWASVWWKDKELAKVQVEY